MKFSLAGNSKVAKKKAPVKASAFFGHALDDGLNINASAKKAKEEAERRKNKKLEREMAAALAEDPMAFAYDEVYTDMKRKSFQVEAEKKPGGRAKPKYIANLLLQAKERERTDMLILQKKLQRELAEEKEVYGEDSDKFVTSAYKKQLEKNKIYEAELERKEEEDRKNSFASRGNTGGFLLNILDSRATGKGIHDAAEERGISLKRERAESRSPSPDRDRIKERGKRMRDRAEKDRQQAEELRAKREAEKAKMEDILREEYKQHHTSKEEVKSAKERYLERKAAAAAAKAAAEAGGQ